MMAVSLVLALSLGQAGPVLTLDDALREAEAKNLDLKAAREKLTQSKEISRKVWAAYLPTLTVGASYTRNNVAANLNLPVAYGIRNITPADLCTPAKLQAGEVCAYNGMPSNSGAPATQFPDLSNPIGQPSTSQAVIPVFGADVTIQALNQYGGQAQLSQALVVPALWPAIKNAYLAQDIVTLSVENGRRELLFGVVQLYFGAAGLKEAVAVQKRLLETNREHEKDAQVRYDAGALPKIGLIRAQIDRARSEEDVRRAQLAYDSARIALSTLLDRDANFDVERPAEPQLPESTEKMQKEADDRRLDLQLARQNFDLADRTHSATYYKYAPAIVANGVYRYANIGGFTGQNTSWAITVAANWTLWDGGLRESDLRDSESRAAEAKYNLRAAEIRARDEVKRALLDLESARANKAKAEEQVKLARENMQLVTVNYNNGAATQIEVSDASSQLTSAEIGLVAESINADLSALKLIKSAGLFNPK